MTLRCNLVAAVLPCGFRELGGEDVVRQYTSGLADDACTMLAKAWGTRRLPAALQANMCNVELPCRASCPDQWGYASDEHSHPLRHLPRRCMSQCRQHRSSTQACV